MDLEADHIRTIGVSPYIWRISRDEGDQRAFLA